jgi:hypothetical protein
MAESKIIKEEINRLEKASKKINLVKKMLI